MRPRLYIRTLEKQGKPVAGSLRIAMLSYHTCPLATLGGKDTGGMNVYVRELTRQLGTDWGPRGCLYTLAR